MATIKALIRATKGKDTAFVRFRLSDGRNVQLFYKSTISVNVSLWDTKKGEISTRKICNNAYRRTTNNEIQNTKARLFEVYEQNKDFIKNSHDLTREERDTLTEYDLQEFPDLAKIRDLFIFQCFCGCRISDLLRLTKHNIIGNYLEYIPQKTISKRGRVLRIPLHSVALRIIEKYKDNENLLPNCGSTERINRKLKKLFALCGFTRQVQVLNPITRKEEQKQLCEVVSTHMARRTFIGLLYKQVKDPNLIASMSGHAQNSTAFARYRAIDDEIKSEVIRLL